MKIHKIKINENTLVFENDNDMVRFREGDKNFQIDMSDCRFGRNGIYYATPKSPFWFEINPAEDIEINNVKDISCNYDSLTENIIIVVSMLDGLEHIFYIGDKGVDYTRHRSEKNEKSLLDLCKEKYIQANEEKMEIAKSKLKEFVENKLFHCIEDFGEQQLTFAEEIIFKQFPGIPLFYIIKVFDENGFTIIFENGFAKISGWAE